MPERSGAFGAALTFQESLLRFLWIIFGIHTIFREDFCVPLFIGGRFFKMRDFLCRFFAGLSAPG